MQLLESKDGLNILLRDSFCAQICWLPVPAVGSPGLSPAGYHISPMSQASIVSRLAAGLTARRVYMHGLILAISIWAPYAVDVSKPGLRDRFNLLKGTDFLHFYTLGSLAILGRGSDLYDTVAQAALARQLVPGVEGVYFVALYGPQVSLFFASLAIVPYAWALIAWWLLTTLVFLGCCNAIWRLCPNLQRYGPLVLILGLAYPAFFHLIAWGQTSAPALFCFVLAYVGLHNRQEFLAGLAIGLLAFKPPLGLAAAFIFVFASQWRVVIGAV